MGATRQAQGHMFTLEHINHAHERLGTAATLPAYVRALHAMGVERYTSYVSDGRSEYGGRDGYAVTSPPVHETLTIAETSDRDQFLEHLNRHNEQKTTYLEMSRGLAESGIEKWTVDTTRMTIMFYDKAGNDMLMEAIG